MAPFTKLDNSGQIFPQLLEEKRTAADFTCSVVVCTRDRLEALDECLAAIAKGTKSATEVIVVDSAPMYANAEQVASKWGAKYVCESRPGVSRARNRGAYESTSDILAYVDGDAVPEPGWLEPLLAEFADPRVALVAGKVLPPKTDRDLLPIYAWFGIVDHGQEQKVFDRSVSRWYEMTNFDCVLLGVNMAARRAVFEDWPGFDERLGVGTRIHGNEEPKAFFELVDRGYRVVYVPNSIVRHVFPRLPEQLRLRALRAIEASAAYLALLFCEQPAYRKETWNYIKSKLKQVRPIYTRDITRSQAFIPGYRVMIARLKGVCLYFATRLTGRCRSLRENK